LLYWRGEGKTTAAMGMAVRAAGDGKNVFILQFVKAAAKSSEQIKEGEWPVSSEINFLIIYVLLVLLAILKMSRSALVLSASLATKKKKTFISARLY